MLKNAIKLPGVSNARELGGYAAGDKTVKKGVLLRTGKLNTAPPEAIRSLTDTYKVRTIIDFRMSDERMRLPDPDIAQIDNIGLSVIEKEDYPRPDPKVAEKLKLFENDRMAMFELLYDSGMLGPEFYDIFLLCEHGIMAYKEFFRILLNNDPNTGAVLWHCTDGKDRTGCAAMLLLTALGTDRRTIMEDYLLTNEYNADMLDFIRTMTASASGTGKISEQKINALTFISGGVSEIYLEHAISTLDKEFGSVEGYLSQVLGIGTAEKQHLREKYLV